MANSENNDYDFVIILVFLLSFLLVKFWLLMLLLLVGLGLLAAAGPASQLGPGHLGGSAAASGGRYQHRLPGLNSQRLHPGHNSSSNSSGSSSNNSETVFLGHLKDKPVKFRRLIQGLCKLFFKWDSLWQKIALLDQSEDPFRPVFIYTWITASAAWLAAASLD